MKKQYLVAGLIAAYLLYIGFYYLRAIIQFRYVFHDWHYDMYVAAWLFGIAGLVQFITSGWKSSRLLLIWLFYTQTSQLIYWLIFLVSSFFRHRPAYFASYYILETVFFAGGYYCLIVLSRTRIAVIEAVPSAEAGKEPAYVFHPADKWTRFANNLLDTCLILLVILVNWTYLRYMSQINLSGLTDLSWLGIRIVLNVLLFLYYLLLEGIVGISFGKLITNTVIVNESGQRPTIGQTIRRTFSRLIPFDGLSFLFGKRGWHDLASRTYVTGGRSDPM
jgi:uncharacterized RDD family membrane protein YckC